MEAVGDPVEAASPYLKQMGKMETRKAGKATSHVAEFTWRVRLGVSARANLGAEILVAT